MFCRIRKFRWFPGNIAKYFWTTTLKNTYERLFFQYLLALMLFIPTATEKAQFKLNILPGVFLSSPQISVHFCLATGLSQSCGLNWDNSRQYIFVLMTGLFENADISFWMLPKTFCITAFQSKFPQQNGV